MLDPRDAPFDVFAGIVLLSLAVAFSWVRLFGRANIRWRRAAGWCVLTVLLVELVVAARGYLAVWDRLPPPFMVMMAFIFGSLIYVSRRFGPALSKLPFYLLVGLQGFRLPLELVMHHAATAGIMPNVMSFSGYNFDIVTGASAIVVATLAYRNQAPGWLIWTWNAVGSLLLLIVVGIAIAASPMSLAFGFSEINTWVTHPPFVWLPGILVPAAALGHLVIWRKLIEARVPNQ